MITLSLRAAALALRLGLAVLVAAGAAAQDVIVADIGGQRLAWSTNADGEILPIDDLVARPDSQAAAPAPFQNWEEVQSALRLRRPGSALPSWARRPDVVAVVRPPDSEGVVRVSFKRVGEDVAPYILTFTPDQSPNWGGWRRDDQVDTVLLFGLGRNSSEAYSLFRGEGTESPADSSGNTPAWNRALSLWLEDALQGEPFLRRYSVGATGEQDSGAYFVTYKVEPNGPQSPLEEETPLGDDGRLTLLLTIVSGLLAGLFVVITIGLVMLRSQIRENIQQDPADEGKPRRSLWRFFSLVIPGGSGGQGGSDDPGGSGQHAQSATGTPGPPAQAPFSRQMDTLPPGLSLTDLQHAYVAQLIDQLRQELTSDEPEPNGLLDPAARDQLHALVAKQIVGVESEATISEIRETVADAARAKETSAKLSGQIQSSEKELKEHREWQRGQSSRFEAAMQEVWSSLSRPPEGLDALDGTQLGEVALTPPAVPSMAGVTGADQKERLFFDWIKSAVDRAIVSRDEFLGIAQERTAFLEDAREGLRREEEKLKNARPAEGIPEAVRDAYPFALAAVTARGNKQSAVLATHGVLVLDSLLRLALAAAAPDDDAQCIDSKAALGNLLALFRHQDWQQLGHVDAALAALSPLEEHPLLQTTTVPEPVQNDSGDLLAFFGTLKQGFSRTALPIRYLYLGRDHQVHTA